MQLTTPASGKEPGLEHASTGMPDQCTACAPTHSMRIVVKNLSETFVKNAAVNSGVIIKKKLFVEDFEPFKLSYPTSPRRGEVGVEFG